MPVEPITVDLAALLRLGPRSKVDLGEGHVYEVRLPYEHSRAVQMDLNRLSTRRAELQKRLDGEGEPFGELSAEEVDEFDGLAMTALEHLLVSTEPGVDAFVSGLSPSQRTDLLNAIGLLNMRVTADQKKAVESTSSTLLSSVLAPSPPRSPSGSSKRRPH